MWTKASRLKGSEAITESTVYYKIKFEFAQVAA